MRTAESLGLLPPIIVHSTLLNGEVPPKVKQRVYAPSSVSLADMDADLAPEYPCAPQFAPDYKQPEPEPVRTPYFPGYVDLNELGITDRHDEVAAAARSGRLNGCGLTPAGITLYPDAFKDHNRSRATIAQTRAERAVGACAAWFFIKNI